MNITQKKDKDWCGEVCSLSDYVCKKCGKDFSYSYYFDDENKRNLYVCAHHIKSKKAYPELRYDPKNGICVCKDCHTKIIHN